MTHTHIKYIHDTMFLFGCYILIANTMYTSMVLQIMPLLEIVKSFYIIWYCFSSRGVNNLHFICQVMTISLSEWEAWKITIDCAHLQ